MQQIVSNTNKGHSICVSKRNPFLDLLRMALEGRICLCLKPPKEFHPEKFVDHQDVSTIKNLLAFDKVSSMNNDNDDESVSNQLAFEEEQSSEEEEEEDTLTTAAKNKFSALLQSTDE